MMSHTFFRRGAVLLIGAAALGLSPATTTPVLAQADDASALGAGGEFFAVTPDRVYDSKDDVAGGRVDASGEITVNVVGVGGVPAEDVLAVAVNVTVVGTPGRGFVSVRPSDYDASADEPTSLINFEAGQTVPNFSIIGVGSEGALTIDLNSEVEGDVRVAVDVFGWVAKSAYAGDDADDGARLRTVTPERILNTRESSSLGTQESIEVPVLGQGPVPDDPSISAVVVNMTGINNKSDSTTTYLSASPDQVPEGQDDADVSNGNFGGDTVKANLAIVPVNDDGSIYVFNREGNTDVLLDVVGYMETPDAADNTTAGRIVPLESPFRSFNTRAEEFGSQRLGFSSWEDWSFQDFANSVTLNGVTVGDQTGLLGNLTAVGLEPVFPGEPVTSFLTMNPSVPGGFSEAPGNSNLNFGEGGAVANSAVITYGTNGDGDDNMVSAYNADGSVHYILDVYAVVLD